MAPKPEPFGVEEYFLAILHDDKNLSVGIAAIKTLLMMLKMTEVKTMQGLRSNIQDSIEIMLKTNQPITAIVSGSELFSRFITLGKFDDKSMDECRAIMLNRGQIFLKKLEESRQIIATKASPFITDGCKILTHSRSRAVLEAMIQAKTSNKRFHVYVTKDSPDNLGDQMVADLTQAGIECTAILDSATGYVMESVDFVMVGAEGVVESGGIINKVGSFTIGLCALEMKKPFYVLAESFKFTRLYPLNQRDLPNDYKFPRKSTNSNFDKTHPLVDYTPPAYITLLFTDLGILTPSAISDELIKLYL